MCHDDCEKHFPDRQRYNGILFVANSRKNAETLFFVLTFGQVGFTGFRSLFFDRTFQNETLYKVPSSRKSETKKRKTTATAPTSERGKFSQEKNSTTTVFRSHEHEVMRVS